MQKSKLVTYATAVILTVLVGSAFTIAANWTPSAGGPPGNNTDTPLNVGATAQTKNGPLTIKGLLETTVGGIKFPDGTVQTTATTPSIAQDGPACDFDGTWGYNDEGGGNDFGLSCKDGKIVGWCGGGSLGWYRRGFTPGQYGCIPWITVLTAHKPNQDPPGWATEKVATFTARQAIEGVRVWGTSNDGGYCYASWGTGHVETYRHDPATGYYNLNNQYYDGQPIYDSSKLATQQIGFDSEGYPIMGAYCTSGTLVEDPYSCGENYCSQTCQVGTSACPSNPPTFTNDGTVKICQVNYSAGAFGTQEKYGVNIPVGTVITLKSNFVDGPGSGNVSCYMDVVYK